MQVIESGYERDRETRQDEMRKRILNAAMKLFLGKGFHNVTMRNIASEIKYSPSTIYRYFADKDEIFFALRGLGFELFEKALTASATSPDPKEHFRLGLQSYVDFALGNPEWYDIMFIMRAPLERADEREEWARTAVSFDVMRDGVRQAIEAGILPDDDVDTISFSLLSVMHGILTLIFRQRASRLTQVPDRVLASQVVDFVFNNLVIG